MNLGEILAKSELLTHIKTIRMELVDYVTRMIDYEDNELNEMLEYVLRAGRKLRAAFVIFGYEASLSGCSNHALILPAAAAVELLHKSSLLHDDIVDKDDFRRGLPAFHLKYGLSSGIIFGDLLVATAFCTLEKLEENFPPMRVRRCYETLTEAFESVCKGKSLDLQLMETTDVGLSDYLRMVSLKVSSLFVAALRMGSTLAEAQAELIRTLEAYGENFGICFQIQNDINNVLSLEEQLGGVRGKDLVEGKKTILVVRILTEGPADCRQELLRIWGKRRKTPEDAEKLLETVERSGALEYAEELRESYATKAKRAAEKLEEERVRRFLLEAVDLIRQEAYWKPPKSSFVEELRAKL